jgi:hypothetical protein
MKSPTQRKAASSSGPSVSLGKVIKNYILAIFLTLGAFWGFHLMYLPFPEHSGGPGDLMTKRLDALVADSSRGEGARILKNAWLKPFQEIITRARDKQKHCRKVLTDDIEEPTEDVIAIANMTTARLPGFGVIQALEEWRKNPKPSSDIAYGASNTQCVIPPENECDEKQFTVVFMAYNPDRLKALMNQMAKMLNSEPFDTVVHEIILVWNGPREVSESDLGKQLLEFAQKEQDRCRIVYPLKEGLPNDLMNRYHPDIVQPNTKGILFYDDDGPFYSYEAVLGGFELWKRNANAQIGAMARVIDLGPRQAEEKKKTLKGELDTQAFISHCATDDVEYNFRFFANFQANMVLPSGSFLHANYLCFLWHPAFEPIREYVRAHPVHPDDMTVSMMVSQLAGRAPAVYSRRINMETRSQKEKRRKLLFGIDWDANNKMDDAKENWAQLRSGAVNSLVRYFGSINSGSLGWCYGTEYHKKDRNGEDMCDPLMARFGKLPWMNPDHTPKDQCP